MVKLFVGNLADSVDSAQLRQLFTQFVEVQECDVLKNFAFIHVRDDEAAKQCLEHLDNTMLEGRPIHIEKSTSRLRREPGMGDKCFRCGGYDHKTPNCPIDKGEDSVRGGDRNRRRPSPGFQTNGSKRPPPSGSNISDGSYPPAKRSGSPLTWGYSSQQPQQQQPFDTYRSAEYLRNSAPMQPRTDPDPLLPRPRERDLDQLYEQYVDARQRYYYFRDRLSKELQARAQESYAPPPTMVAQSAASYGQQQYAQYDYSGANQQQQSQSLHAAVRYPDMYAGYHPGAQQPATNSYGYAAPNASMTSQQPAYMASFAGSQQQAQPRMY